MSNKSKRSELKENILASKLEGSLSWLVERKVQALTMVGIVFGALLVSSVFILSHQETEKLNWTRLAQAQQLIRANQVPQAKEILMDIVGQSPNSKAGIFSEYYLGDLHLQLKNYSEAINNFLNVVQKTSNSPLNPLALASLGFSYHESQQYGDAAQTYQSFMDSYSDHFMAPRIQLSLGKSLAYDGDMDNAKAALGQLIDIYPTSIWAENARRFLDKIESR